jgi:hypothetical protein
MTMRTPVLLATPLLLAACAQGEPRTAQPMVPAGDPVNCVQTNQIRSTSVLDDQTIDFRMRNGQVMRNTLPSRCPGLGFSRAFSYRTTVGQLCNVDIITVVNQGGGPRTGASCGLGQFTPVKPEAAEVSAQR